MTELRLLIVSDDPLARAGLVTLLAENCQIVGQMSSFDLIPDGHEADYLGEIDVIVWDLGWDTGTDLPDWQDIHLPIVALVPDETMAIDAWTAGIQAILPRDVDADALMAAAYTAVHGLITIAPDFTNILLPATAIDSDEAVVALTPREDEVLQLLAEGLTNKAIAHQLQISNHTVKFHVNAILTKLGAQSRTEAVVRATRLGLILL